MKSIFTNAIVPETQPKRDEAKIHLKPTNLQEKESDRDVSGFVADSVLKNFSRKVSAASEKRVEENSDEEPEENCWLNIVIIPDSTFRNIWDCVVIVLLIYTITVLPLRVAFVAETSQVDAIDVVVDLLFFMDIVISFLSAYVDSEGYIVTDPKMITQKYMTTWFIPDVVATFPFYLIGQSSVSRLSGVLRIPRLLKVLRLVRLVKLIRTYKLKKVFEALEYSPRVHQGVVRIGKLLFLVISFGHFSACIWYFIGDISRIDGELHPDSWIKRAFSETGNSTLIDEDNPRKYLVALYWAITTLTTVGFGDITPETSLEISFTILMMLTGATVFSYITATVSSVLHDLDAQASRFRIKMTNLLRFIRSSDMSNELHAKLMDTMAHIWRNEGVMRDVGSLREEMPRQLCFEVALEFHAELIDKSAFFRMFAVDEKEHQFIGELVAELKPYSAYDGEFVGNVGDPVSRWSIISSGTVVALSPLDSDLELMWWQDGDSFAEVGIFLTQHWGWNMQCCSDCLFYFIDTRQFLSIVAHHRSVSQKFVRLAGERVFRIQKTKKNLKRLQAVRRQEALEKEKETKMQGVHYRLKGLLESANSDQADEDDVENAPDRHTAKGRWRFLRSKVVSKKCAISSEAFRQVTKMAVQVRKFQTALDEIKRDMRIWKQGMTIQADVRYDNFLQPEEGITGFSTKHEEKLNIPSPSANKSKSILHI